MIGFRATGRRTFLTAAAICAALLVYADVVSAQQKPAVVAEVDRQEVYLGESIIYQITVQNADSSDSPKLDGFDAFDIEELGQRSQSMQSIVIRGGRQQIVVENGTIFQYRLTPKVPGKVTIPAPTATVEGKKLNGQQIPISVVAPEDQETVIMELSVDRPAVYPLQEFTITLDVAIRELPDELAPESPLSVQGRQPVKLKVPWLEDDELPAGLEPLNTWREILEPLATGANRRGGDGMQINNIGSQSAFSFFSDNRKALFLPASERMKRTLTEGREARYVNYRLARTFKGKQTGSFVFAASTIKGTFGTELVGKELNGENIYALSNALTVDVKPVPADGQPTSFIGGVGTFDISADLNPRNATVGDPVTLSVSIHGKGTVADIRAPNINDIEGLTDRFRIYDVTEETMSNGRTFTWSLRPLTKEVSEFPAVPVSYFDVQQEKYVTKASDPIPMVVSAATKLAASDILSTQETNAAESQNEFRLNDAGLFANYTDLKMLRAADDRIVYWIPIWGTMTLSFLLVNFGIARRQKQQADPSLQRRKNARSRAAAALSRLISNSETDADASVEPLRRIVTGLVADFTNSQESALTATDVEKSLTNLSVDGEVRRRVADFLAQCDAARYGDKSASLKSLTSECEALLNDLGTELSRRC